MRALALALALGLTTASAAQAHDLPTLNDYPTVARADYVFGCMAANGQTRQVLEKCACSIDLIATILPYDAYVEGETVLSMRLVGGERMAIFRNAEVANAAVTTLRRAQAEAEIRCF